LGLFVIRFVVDLQDHVRKTMEKGLYQLEDGELVPEPTLLETKQVLFNISSFSCSAQSSFNPRVCVSVLANFICMLRNYLFYHYRLETVLCLTNN
jgi:hypothetical protein